MMTHPNRGAVSIGKPYVDQNTNVTPANCKYLPKLSLFKYKKIAQIKPTFSFTFVYWAKFVSVAVLSVRMTVPWQCTVQPMSGVSAMFILDDRCNLPLYQLMGQSISHYSFQTISSWLRLPRHHNTFSPSDIMFGYFRKAQYNVAANIVNLFGGFASNSTASKDISFYFTPLYVYSSFSFHPLPPTLFPLSLSLCYYSFFSGAALKQALLVWFTFY